MLAYGSVFFYALVVPQAIFISEQLKQNLIGIRMAIFFMVSAIPKYQIFLFKPEAW